MVGQIIGYYDQFLNLFPMNWHGPISLILLLAIAGTIWHIVRKSGLWLVLLIVLVPALIPVLRDIGKTLIEILKVLLERANI
jgi:hypothetical protein